MRALAPASAHVVTTGSASRAVCRKSEREEHVRIFDRERIQVLHMLFKRAIAGDAIDRDGGAMLRDREDRRRCRCGLSITTSAENADRTCDVGRSATIGVSGTTSSRFSLSSFLSRSWRILPHFSQTT